MSPLDNAPADVRAAIEKVAPAKRRRDAETLLALFDRATGVAPTMWSTIVAYGSYHYKYASGREGDAPAAGFAPRKSATVVYLNDGTADHADLIDRLGEHSTGVGCLYLKDLEKVDLDVLEEIVTRSYATLTAGTFTDRARG
ncbi:MAG: DUF1801 domain-containing protein [Intrasporangiaceae bacterium]|nr:DUF1801 domain-containing protein [Intrasporangiaceae bacterium]